MAMTALAALAQVNYSRELEQRAENGNARAMFELSQCYRFGKGVEKSMRLANQWVIRAAEAGHAEAISFCDEMGLSFASPPKPMTYTVAGVSFAMVPVEGGTFTMGATPEQGNDAADWEKPAHQVTLSSYSIGQTEVTQALWLAVMGSNPSYHQASHIAWAGTDLQRPVEMVSYNDCKAFISKLNQLTGKKFRLPTEAEWEYAARGGNRSKGYKYAGSNSLDDVAWYKDNSMALDPYYCGTYTVATKAPNELGLYDMSGNVYEWCSDFWGTYFSHAQTNPIGGAGTERILRGGCYSVHDWYHRVSSRRYGPDSAAEKWIGLRLAL